MIAFTIDEITPCLKNTETGELVQTEVVELKRKSFLSRFNSRNGWYINWGKFASNIRVFALVLEGTMEIQGLIAVILVIHSERFGAFFLRERNHYGEKGPGEQ